MCIVMIADRKKPSDEDLVAAACGNQDGAGIAWCEGGMVHWKKGIMGEPEDVAAQVGEIVAAHTLPFLIHFRVATEGGVSPALTHPFPVSIEKPHLGGDLALEGVGDAVLMHNGHWNSWKHEMKEARRFMFTEPKKKGSTMSDFAIPRGPWSDSRAMAWLISLYGLGYLPIELNNQKVALLDGNGLIWYYATKDWQRDEDGGYLRSSPLWKERSKRVSGDKEKDQKAFDTDPLARFRPASKYELARTNSKVVEPGGTVVPFVKRPGMDSPPVPLADPQTLLESGDGELVFQQAEVEIAVQDLIAASSGVKTKY